MLSAHNKITYQSVHYASKVKLNASKLTYDYMSFQLTQSNAEQLTTELSFNVSMQRNFSFTFLFKASALCADAFYKSIFEVLFKRLFAPTS